MDYLPFIWAIGGILLIGAEFFVPGFVVFFFGAGAILTAVASGLVPGLGSRYVIQLSMWVIVSLLSIAFFRETVAAVFQGSLLAFVDEEDTTRREAVVVERVVPGVPGQIRFQGAIWKAVSEEATFEEGETVLVVDTENQICRVTRPPDRRDLGHWRES